MTSATASTQRVSLARFVDSFVARVGRWQAPPRNLLLTALVLLVFPWDEVTIDAVFAGFPTLPAVGAYLVWATFDCALIWVVLATGRLWRPAIAYAAITFVLDSMQAAVYEWVTQYTAFYMVATGMLDIAYVALITVVMRVRLKEASSSSGWSGKWLGLGRATPSAESGTSAQTRDKREASLFAFVIPLIVSIAVAYAVTFFAALTCTAHPGPHGCTSYGPRIALGFFDQTGHIIAILLVALAIEGGLLVRQRGREEAALVSVTIIGLAVGIAASLTASGAHSGSLPLTFPLTVQALALGLTTILLLPSLTRDRTVHEHVE